jgi:hypothetical protein
MKENEELNNENKEIKQQIQSIKILLQQKAIEINELSEKLENKEKVIESVKVENQSVYQNILLLRISLVLVLIRA